jgi:biotin carboxyl carrier protein
MKYQVRYGEREIEVDIEGEPPRYVLRLDGEPMRADVTTLGDPSLFSMLIENVSCLAHVVKAAPGVFEVSMGGKLARFEVLDQLAAMAQRMHAPSTGGDSVLRSPMPGLVVSVRVAPGDRVEPGTPLVVVEAMKMQNEMTSEVAGIVRAVHVREHQSVESGAELVRIDRDGR